MKLTDGNWVLKILALALAIIIYHALKNDTSSKAIHSTHDRTIFKSR